MKKTLFVNVSLLLGICFQAFSQQNSLPDRGLCAHRGAMTTHPENTVPAFLEAIRVGAQMIEFDVQFSKDSALVIMHDGTVDRTTDGTGKVAEMTLSEIKALDAGSWKEEAFAGTGVPVLQEVMDIMPRNIWLNIHIKGGREVGREVAKLVMATDRGHQAVLAVEEEARLGAQEVYPDILICNMERQSGKWDYVEATVSMQADFIQLRGSVSPEFPAYASKLHAAGVKINYFGTDDAEQIQELWKVGIDFPLVNDIVTAISVGEKLGIPPVIPK
ncbi:glycerophosphodiester phosphodiesterase [Lunatibacter salilacus]|uniref:glycerophosphodiester phosphodiesterase n=1 Tax=Lunatibacter salilacus TaxID=2483804 RepID=UPI001F2E327A|nr:glycerophosphodiester phosphodiesterase family protein [Lunatibacter salilacus]